mmetsp:Transcript_31288/g.69001  ORF Transcript_31288/g.69001 Transcript_31288/m.69001 type:complete len:259 (+) Transcript_31288:960-1736(+)
MYRAVTRLECVVVVAHNRGNHALAHCCVLETHTRRRRCRRRRRDRGGRCWCGRRYCGINYSGASCGLSLALGCLGLGHLGAGRVRSRDRGRSGSSGDRGRGGTDGGGQGRDVKRGLLCHLHSCSRGARGRGGYGGGGRGGLLAAEHGEETFLHGGIGGRRSSGSDGRGASSRSGGSDRVGSHSRVGGNSGSGGGRSGRTRNLGIIGRLACLLLLLPLQVSLLLRCLRGLCFLQRGQHGLCGRVFIQKRRHLGPVSHNV